MFTSLRLLLLLLLLSLLSLLLYFRRLFTSLRLLLTTSEKLTLSKTCGFRCSSNHHHQPSHHYRHNHHYCHNHHYRYNHHYRHNHHYHNHHNQNGKKIWEALWEFRHPDLDCFTAQVIFFTTQVKLSWKKCLSAEITSKNLFL